MKTIVTLAIIFLTNNSYSFFELEISANESGATQSKVFEKQKDALNHAIEVSKIKNTWRKGVVNTASENALYSFVKNECVEIVTGQQQVTVQNEEGNDKAVTVDVREEQCSDVTYYYHPSNWSYYITDVTIEEQAKKDKEASIEALREKLKTEDLKLDEMNSLLRGYTL